MMHSMKCKGRESEQRGLWPSWRLWPSATEEHKAQGRTRGLFERNDYGRIFTYDTGLSFLSNRQLSAPIVLRHSAGHYLAISESVLA